MLTLTASASTWYASPSGSGSGSIGSPWALATALASGSIQPGDTLYLRGGTYSGSFTSTLNGSSGNNITIMSYPGEWAVIDRAATTGANTFTINGSYVTVRDLEVTNSNTTRDTEAGRPTGVDMFAVGSRLVNLVIHDSGNGIGCWEEATDAEVTGCIVYNNGWFTSISPDGTGHGIYIQNDAPSRKIIRNNLFLNQCGYGVHAYSTAGPINNLTFRHNVCLNNGAWSPINAGNRLNNMLYGGHVPAYGAVAHTNYLYHSVTGNGNARFGLYATTNGDLDAVGNYIIGGGADTFEYWTNAVVSLNTVYSSGGDLTITTNAASSVYTWNNNTYYIGGVWIYQGVNKTFSQWKTATGYDAASTQTSPASISGTWKFVHANPDTPTKGYAVIWNWPNADNVSVDISPIVSVGASYTIKDAQAYQGATILSGTYSGGTISFPMTNLTATLPLGLASVSSTTGPRFEVFTIESSSTPSAIISGALLRNVKL